MTRHKKGAVAPTVALSLFALIGMGGIAFDYARLADLDTELQNAADQAALAAATQLDGSTGSRARAEAAAKSLLNNTSLFASDDGTDTDKRKVTIATVEFFEGYNEETDVYGDPATSDAEAKVVEVSVGGRRANYALTPVVGVLSSGTMNAKALASLASSVCKVPPLMMCVPAGADFPTANDIGKGLLLQPGPNVGAWAPGDYGYMDFGDGASGLKTNLGRNSEFAGCVNMSDGIPTEPGNKASVTDALNSRFDLYPQTAATCNTTTGDNCPAENTGKDLVRTEEVVISKPKGTVPPPINPGCNAAGFAPPNGTSKVAAESGFVQGTVAKGLTRDACHISGNCSPNAKFGDGEWGRATYFAANHAGELAAAATWAGKSSTAVKGPTALTRYDVYKWELADKPARLATRKTDLTDYAKYKKTTGQTDKYTFTNQCTYPRPVNGTAVVPSSTQKDRRLLTAAAVDCTGLNGKSDVIVKQWVDVFLVEPSLTRTSPYTTGKEQIYVEIVGVAKLPNGNSAFQNYLRQRPRLLR